ncbi:hypothetical protein GGF43_005287, partial [Coemansia sp. RSA 2618]
AGTCWCTAGAHGMRPCSVRWTTRNLSQQRSRMPCWILLRSWHRWRWLIPHWRTLRVTMCPWHGTGCLATFHSHMRRQMLSRSAPRLPCGTRARLRAAAASKGKRSARPRRR